MSTPGNVGRSSSTQDCPQLGAKLPSTSRRLAAASHEARRVATSMRALHVRIHASVRLWSPWLAQLDRTSSDAQKTMPVYPAHTLDVLPVHIVVHAASERRRVGQLRLSARVITTTRAFADGCDRNAGVLPHDAVLVVRWRCKRRRLPIVGPHALTWRCRTAVGRRAVRPTRHSLPGRGSRPGRGCGRRRQARAHALLLCGLLLRQHREVRLHICLLTLVLVQRTLGVCGAAHGRPSSGRGVDMLAIFAQHPRWELHSGLHIVTAGAAAGGIAPAAPAAIGLAAASEVDLHHSVLTS
eukprot:361917-Chlamydomonas_euryale.AAC.13